MINCAVNLTWEKSVSQLQPFDQIRNESVVGIMVCELDTHTCCCVVLRLFLTDGWHTGYKEIVIINNEKERNSGGLEHLQE